MDEQTELGVPDATPESHGTVSATRWVLIALVVVALLLFIAWARRNPPFDDRVRDEDGMVALVAATDAGGGR